MQLGLPLLAICSHIKLGLRQVDCVLVRTCQTKLISRLTCSSLLGLFVSWRLTSHILGDQLLQDCWSLSPRHSAICWRHDLVHTSHCNVTFTYIYMHKGNIKQLCVRFLLRSSIKVGSKDDLLSSSFFLAMHLAAEKWRRHVWFNRKGKREAPGYRSRALKALTEEFLDTCWQ